MDAKLRSPYVSLLAALTAIAGIALLGPQARAESLVSSFPDSTPGGPHLVQPQARFVCQAEPFGHRDVQLHPTARQKSKTSGPSSRVFVQSFLKHVGAAGLVMTFVPLDNPPPSGNNPPPPPVTSGSGGGPTHPASAPEPGTLLAGVLGAGLIVGLALLRNHGRKGALAIRA
jgi:hypothetical protein